MPVVFAVLFFSGLAQAAPAIFSPEAGVLCDKKAGFCADSQGVIPPFFGALKSRGHAACAKRCFGV
ncbi:YcgJ family protein [Aeromonas allosaccharophila]